MQAEAPSEQAKIIKELGEAVQALSEERNSYLVDLEKAKKKVAELEIRLAKLSWLSQSPLGAEDPPRYQPSPEARAALAFHYHVRPNPANLLRQAFDFRRPSVSQVIRTLAKFGVFQRDWYLEKYRDVARSGIDPLAHYVQHGFGEGRWPHPLFDTNFYLLKNVDVASSGQNPFIHYLEKGWREGRDPNRFLNVSWYKKTYADKRPVNVDPMTHYFEIGAKEMLNPSPDFSTESYRNAFLEVDFESVNPLAHFLETLSNNNNARL